MLRGLDEPRPLLWRVDSKARFAAFPAAVQREMAKTLKGFGGGAAVEVRDNHDGNTYRAIYTVRFADAVYVLHAFQKKSRAGTRTAKSDRYLVDKRLKDLIGERRAAI